MITIKTPEEIEIMAEGGKILSLALKEISAMVKPGITTLDLDRRAEEIILSNGAKPAFKGYAKFPYSLCTSVNEEIVHCFPSNRVLKDGDIISLDLGVLYKGFNTDSAVTIPVGKIAKDTEKLLSVTRKSLYVGIKTIKVGRTFGDIGYQIEKFIAKQKMGLVRDLTGHGIGKNVHEDPEIPNYGSRGLGEVIKEGMVFCIEPMVTLGDYNLRRSSDGYGYSTKDSSLAAHFEHTIAVTKKGPRILT